MYSDESEDEHTTTVRRAEKIMGVKIRESHIYKRTLDNNGSYVETRSTLDRIGASFGGSFMERGIYKTTLN